jgi:hypothetical protein
MSAFIEDIIVEVLPGPATVSRVGFGIPLLVGTTGQRSVLIHGSGTSQLIAKSTPRQNVVSLEIIVAAAYSYAFAAGVVTIEIPAGALVRDLVADFNANAPALVTDELTIEAGTTGSGPVGALVETPLTFTEFRQIVDISQLKYYYDTSDVEYKMISNMKASKPSPITIYLLDVFADLADIPAAIELNDTGVWYAIVTNSLTESDQQDIVDYVSDKQRLAFLTSSDKTVLTRIKDRRAAWLIHDVPADHPEASWVAKGLPQTPGSITWKYLNPLAGQSVNETATLSDLLEIRNNKGQSYVRANGVPIVDEGQTTDPDAKTYIDSVRSQDWIDLNMTADINQLFVDAGASGSKLSYTDEGISQIGAAVANRLTLAGRAGIIAPVETAEQAELSTDGKYRFKVDVPTRAEIAAATPEQIAARNVPGITFQYVEAGAIHEVKTITGRIVLSEV